MDKYWQDPISLRPGTAGSDTALNHQNLAIGGGFALGAAQPTADASDEGMLAGPRAARVPHRFEWLDLGVAVVVFVATWLVLWRSTTMGAGEAAAAGFIAGCLAARWWRQQLALIIVAVVLAVYFRSH